MGALRFWVIAWLVGTLVMPLNAAEEAPAALCRKQVAKIVGSNVDLKLVAPDRRDRKKLAKQITDEIMKAGAADATKLSESGVQSKLEELIAHAEADLEEQLPLGSGAEKRKVLAEKMLRAGLKIAGTPLWRRTSVMKQLLDELEKEAVPLFPVLSRAKLREHVKHLLAKEEERIAESLPGKAIAAYGASVFVAGVASGAKFYIGSVYPSVAPIINSSIDVVMGAFVNPMITAGAMLVNAKISNRITNYTGERKKHFASGQKMPPDVVNRLKRAISREQERVDLFVNGIRGTVTGSINAAETGNVGIRISGEILGDREQMARELAENMRVYLELYPQVDPDEDMVSNAMRAQLQKWKVGSRKFRSRVMKKFEEAGYFDPFDPKQPNRLLLKKTDVYRLLNAWCPYNPQAKERNYGPPSLSTKNDIDAHLTAVEGYFMHQGHPRARSKAVRAAADAVMGYLSYKELFDQHEHGWLTAIHRKLEDVDDPSRFKEEIVRELANRNERDLQQKGDEAIQVDIEEAGNLLDQWLPAPPWPQVTAPPGPQPPASQERS